MSHISNYMNISEIVGFVFTKVEYDDCEEEIIFTRDNGERFIMKHEQDCCESVYLADREGEWDYLVNTPILMAEQSSKDGETTEDGDSSTWTFYKFGTIKGYVDLRWYGSSNGYYSEGVSFGELENEDI